MWLRFITKAGEKNEEGHGASQEHSGKESAANVGDAGDEGWIPGSGWSQTSWKM